ncbi:MAG: extracellular solute-binding protein [Paenibacillaceae bacterium]|jgi:putative aldouronate transport system substrate-binding protein|nr:extracellular solute-binding protein [Paenibacillaceae bacterium]
MRGIWRKWSAIALAGALLVAAGCSENTKSTDGKSADKNAQTDIVSAAGQFPLTSEKVTLNVMVEGVASVQDYSTNNFTKWLEDKTNVHINWQVVPSDPQQAAQKLNLVLAGGDYPDVIMNFNITPTTQLIWGSQGVFLPLNDLIDKYGDETKKMFKDEPSIKSAVTAIDGKIYGLPYVNINFHEHAKNKMWLYQPWLDKLKIKPPTTTDEFEQMLLAFKTKDPNGNGKADEIALAGSPQGAPLGTYLLNSFVYYNAANEDGQYLYVDNGQIKASFADAGYKDGMKYLHKLFAEGLIYPQSFTQDKDQLKRLGENPDAEILGAVPAFTQSFVQNGSEHFKGFTTLPPLKGPSGLRQTPWDEYLFSQGQYVITKASKHPDVAFRLADLLYNEEVTMTAKFGTKDKGWSAAKPGELGLDGKQGIWTRNADWGKGVQNDFWGQTGPSYQSEINRNGLAGNALATGLYKETKKNYEPYKAAKNVPPLFFSDQQSKQLADMKNSIITYVDEMKLRFITGDADIDKSWNDYLKTLDSLQLKAYLQLFQTTYDKTYKK